MQRYRVCSVYDTETTNYIAEGAAPDTCIAFPVLYIFNDLRSVDISDYVPDASDDIRFYRDINRTIAYIVDLIYYGRENDLIPVIAAYNLMFDLKPILPTLNDYYPMCALAQSSTSAYTVDIIDEDTGAILLRFWDTFYLEMRGLAAMGETCGLKKACGDWDYTLVRAPQTPLTDDELFYAGRDTQVIPAYLNFLLRSNSWLKSDMFGWRVLTKTSLVRLQAKNEIAKIKPAGGKKTVGQMYAATCESEAAPDYDTYALRRACFRGGLSFTSARFASTLQRNVASLDVTSMHHTYINGRFMPVEFVEGDEQFLTEVARDIARVPLKNIYRNYAKPFVVAMHAYVHFENLRLKAGSVFEHYEIGLLSQSKFHRRVVYTPTGTPEDQRNTIAEIAIRDNGYFDKAKNAIFAYGKLMQASECDLFLSEVELWCVAQVYDWDNMHVKFGEYTGKFRRPPDYVSLQSNVLFERKTACKEIVKNYVEGEPYTGVISDAIPDNMADELRAGTMCAAVFKSYYQSTVKGMFNGIYGTQAQDIYKPDYTVWGGDLTIDRTTVVNDDNFSERTPRHINVLYTYGLRIVAGSRQHLIIAIMLMYEAYGDKVRILGGDTDSLKIACAPDITDDMLLSALKPLHDAVTTAINYTQERIRDNYPAKASPLTNVGLFDIEDCGAKGVTRWDEHVELWNKARISMYNGKSHVTMAGLPRPHDDYNIETAIDDLVAAGNDFGDVVINGIGYNTIIDNRISHFLQRVAPKGEKTFTGRITDYRGNTYDVVAPHSIALYEADRTIGDTSKLTNYFNECWQEMHGRHLNTTVKRIRLRDGKPVILDASDDRVIFSCDNKA